MIGQMFFSQFAAACSGGDVLGFPKWYKYLDGATDATGACAPVIGQLNDVWLIVAAVIEILLRVAALGAIMFVMFGGFQYLTSQGEPDALSKAKRTIINALVGLAIAVLAASIVNFIASSIH